MALLAVVANFPTSLSHLHCHICIGLPNLHYQLVLSLYLHQLESHQLSLHKWLSQADLVGTKSQIFQKVDLKAPLTARYAIFALLSKRRTNVLLC